MDRSAASQASPGGAGEPSYPMGFAEMLKLLQEGKPIPGIRQIPNTVARDPVRLYLHMMRQCSSYSYYLSRE